MPMVDHSSCLLCHSNISLLGFPDTQRESFKLFNHVQTKVAIATINRERNSDLCVASSEVLSQERT